MRAKGKHEIRLIVEEEVLEAPFRFFWVREIVYAAIGCVVLPARLVYTLLHWAMLLARLLIWPIFVPLAVTYYRRMRVNQILERRYQRYARSARKAARSGSRDF